jgi:predicted flavoprotein YhiN
MTAEQLVGWAEPFRALIERAGAELVGVKTGEILFRADAASPICSLYPFACNEENVRLALKSAAEAKKAAQWEFEAAESKASL